MAGKKAAGENTKKAAGNAKKADAASAKQAVEDQKQAKADAEEWSKGAKTNAKKEAADAKAAADAQKKAEKAALLAAEEASQPSKPKGAGAKTAVKKTLAPARGLDLSQLDAPPSGPAATLNASGIDNALDALSLATGAGGAADKIDRHPERRFKAAYAAYEERRLEEMAGEKGLRRQQKIEQIRKEFEKSPENPFNQAQAGTYDMSKEEMKDMKAAEKARVEARLVG